MESDGIKIYKMRHGKRWHKKMRGCAMESDGIKKCKMRMMHVVKMGIINFHIERNSKSYKY